MKTIIISLGGALIAPDGVDTDFVKNFSEFIKGREERCVIICGGGAIARRYQKAGRDLGMEKDDLDWLGVYSTYVNAHLVKAMFGDLSHESIITDPSEPVETDKRVIIGAGWKPGFSTDFDAVKIAENLGAETIINLSNIDHVYDKDPKKNTDAKKIDSISWKDFRKLVGDDWDPGLNTPFDPIATKEAEKMGLSVAIMNGNLENLAAFLDGKEFVGTTIN